MNYERFSVLHDFKSTVPGSLDIMCNNETCSSNFWMILNQWESVHCGILD